MEVDEKEDIWCSMALKKIHNNATGIAENLLCLILQSNSIVNKAAAAGVNSSFFF